MQVRLEHTIELAADRYFDEIFFNEEFNGQLFRELGFKERTVLEQVDRGETVFRRVRQLPERDIPGPLQKALRGASLAYEEQALVHKSRQSADIVVIPTIKPDKVKISGTFWIESDGPHRCKRLFDVSTNVNIFGVGAMVEKLIVADIIQGHDKSAEATNRYLREMGQSDSH